MLLHYYIISDAKFHEKFQVINVIIRFEKTNGAGN